MSAPLIRQDVDRHMAGLKEWLRSTEDEKLESMDGFFTARIDGYEDHMQIWRDAYIAFETLLPASAQRILDLGCGTGLELDVILSKRPDAIVTAIDLCQTMLDQLRSKHPLVSILCADYFASDLGDGCYDAVISFETLHHFTPERKAELYAKIRRALRPGGVYLQAEYVACCAEEETLLWEVLRRKRLRDGIPDDRFVHFDVPLTLERELALLRGAGFRRVSSPDCINGACFLRAFR